MLAERRPRYCRTRKTTARHPKTRQLPLNVTPAKYLLYPQCGPLMKARKAQQ